MHYFNIYVLPEKNLSRHLVHVWVHVLELLDGGGSWAVPLLDVLFQVVLPPGLEAADGTGERGGLIIIDFHLHILYYTYQSIYLCIYPTIYVMHLCNELSVYPSIFPSIYLSIFILLICSPANSSIYSLST